MVYPRAISTEEELSAAQIQNSINILKLGPEIMDRVQFNILRRNNICVRENGGTFT